jgi:hypothetical protein
MTVTPAIAAAAAAMLASVAVVGTASSAWADPPTMSGTYTQQVGGIDVSYWIATPCGPGCAQIQTANTPNGPYANSTAQLVGGQWNMSAISAVGEKCDDGRGVPAIFNFSWDPNTLTGHIAATSLGNCGQPPSGTPLAYPAPFTLTKTS